MKKIAIFGLGNPGEKYTQNRHNIGFLILDYLAQQEKWSEENKLEAEIATLKLPLPLKEGTEERGYKKLKSNFLPLFEGGLRGISQKNQKSLLLVKPTTFMNNSGQAVSKVMNYFNIPKEDVLVIQDDIDLPFGSIRFSKDSGPAGHNGIKSIIEHLGTQDFVRLRIGIANALYEKQNIPSEKFVLANFDSEEKTALEKSLLEEISKAIDFYIENGFEKTREQSFLNPKDL